MPPRQPQQPMQLVLHPAVVMEHVGMDEAQILAGVKAGTFPKPVKFDGRLVWVDADIREWIATRIATGDAKIIELNRPSPTMDCLVDALAVACAQDYLHEQAVKQKATESS